MVDLQDSPPFLQTKTAGFILSLLGVLVGGLFATHVIPVSGTWSTVGTLVGLTLTFLGHPPVGWKAPS